MTRFVSFSFLSLYFVVACVSSPQEDPSGSGSGSGNSTFSPEDACLLVCDCLGNDAAYCASACAGAPDPGDPCLNCYEDVEGCDGIDACDEVCNV
jgi:hypothetical protein